MEDAEVCSYGSGVGHGMADGLFTLLDSIDVNRDKEVDVKKKKDLIPAVTIGFRCEVCGKIFARSHPKDPQTRCEKCRGIG